MNSPNSVQSRSDYHHHPMDTSTTAYPLNLPIPVDLFVSKKHPGLTRGDIGFADSSGDVVFRAVKRQTSSSSRSSSSSSTKRLLLDSSGNTLVSMSRQHTGQWICFKGDSSEEKDLIFRVKRTLNTLSRTEFDVLLAGDNRGDAASDFQMKGSPFQKSCTIYRGDSIVAETSLMYKLRQIFVRRNKFRLTIFPGPVDSAFVVALVVIFFD
ncbi:hypothetical protein JRO89_XS09G0026700 [Xanthoceras sorbifolium]|uniref:Protein LURP-one-related 7 n=1 Tax=Xanthoceras sorbifolium TaxID=99658 RepID=A0ABQ8HKA4_9ROSI|nr:hypothetical protein JRO89_XS09G0026700 [Xanthoceras sorbifolium]